VNQILEDLLRVCILTYGKRWDLCLPFAEFSYNNSFQASIEMSPYEALDGRRCRTPLNWSKSSEWAFLGPDLVKEAEDHVLNVRNSILTAQSRQKSYAYHRCRDLEFTTRDHVYLKVSPLKGIRRFQV
jgi:hypothetical protein